MNSNNRYNEIMIDEIILGIFIFLNILNFFADELEKKCLSDNNQERLKRSKDILILTLIITLIIYIYFFCNNYKDYIKNIDSYDSELFKIRCIGSFFVVIGIAGLLYFRIKKRGDINLDIEGMF